MRMSGLRQDAALPGAGARSPRAHVNNSATGPQPSGDRTAVEWRYPRGIAHIPRAGIPDLLTIFGFTPERCWNPRMRPARTEQGIMNPVKALENHGQAVWLDFLARGFVAKGDLKKLIDSDGVKGVTSNPSIFEKAIGSSDEYDGAIGKALKSGDRPVAELFEHLAIEDIQHAADVLRPVYDHLKGDDGFVSLEVSPYLAMDTKGTIAEAERLWKDVNRKNLMVKVPATPEGLPAIQHLIGAGHQHQHHAAVLAEGLCAGRRGLSRGPRKICRRRRRSLPCRQRRQLLRQPHRQRGRQAARRKDRKGQRPHRKGAAGRAEGQGRDRQRQARLSGLQAPVLRRALGQARGQRRQAAAVAVGLDRHQEQGLQRRALCRGADRPQHRQHRAAGDARRLPRSRQAARQP